MCGCRILSIWTGGLPGNTQKQRIIRRQRKRLWKKWCARRENAGLIRRATSKKGVIVRHLILPGHTRDSMEILFYLHKTYGEHIYISVMNQYTPLPQVKDLEPLNRNVTRREYRRVLDFALELGIEQGYFQEGETAKESFIPLFDYEGLE